MSLAHNSLDQIRPTARGVLVQKKNCGIAGTPKKVAHKATNRWNCTRHSREMVIQSIDILVKMYVLVMSH